MEGETSVSTAGLRRLESAVCQNLVLGCPDGLRDVEVIAALPECADGLQRVEGGTRDGHCALGNEGHARHCAAARDAPRWIVRGQRRTSAGNRRSAAVARSDLSAIARTT